MALRVKKLNLTLFIVVILLIVTMSVVMIDKIRFDAYVKSVNENYTLEVNGEKYFPSTVESDKSFIFNEYDNNEVEISVPKESVLNLPEDYELTNSETNEPVAEFNNYLSDGKYVLSFKSGEYSYTYKLTVNNEFSVNVDDTFSQQGGYLVVTFNDLDVEEIVSITTEFLSSNEFIFNPLEMLIPVDYNNVPGQYAVTFTSDKSTLNQPVEIKTVEFVEDYFNINSDVVASASEEPDPVEAEKLANAKATLTPEKLYTSQFMSPSNGRTVSDYGDIRYINGDTTPTAIHYGLDYANVINTPIYSTNEGVVIYTGFDPKAGNLIVIDHGFGITSYYFHLEEILVNVGDSVNNETMIALMGTTGYSTGSHLHFEIHINGVKSNPHIFLENPQNF